MPNNQHKYTHMPGDILLVNVLRLILGDEGAPLASNDFLASSGDAVLFWRDNP